MKPHMTNPRARRLIRHGEARLKRSVKRETVPFAVNPAKPYLSKHDLASGRCTVRDRFGHRCAAHGVHEVHRAFKREFMAAGQ